MTLAEKLRTYVSAMPPHQRERQGGQLLVQGLAHIIEAERQLAEALTLNHDLSREVARLKEESNKRKV